jgi:hypothetical protein
MNKKYSPWTKEEIETLHSLRAAGKDYTEIAVELKRSVRTVAVKCHGLKPLAPELPTVDVPTTVEQDLETKGEDYWARQFDTLSSKYKKVLEEKTIADRLVADIRSMAPKSYATAPFVKTRKRSSGAPQSAVLELSDTHIGAVVQPDQTLTFGRYDFPTFLARLKYLEETIISIVTDHITTECPELVIAVLGDMLDGALGHSNEVGQMDPMFNQFFGGAHALAQFIRNLAPHFPKLRVYDVVGNHTRFQNQHRMPTKNKHSNFDKFLYAMVRELVRDIPTIEWEFTQQPYQVFDVQGFTFFAGHGENLRGGDKALGIPNHSVGRLVSTTSQLFSKHNMKAPNYYLFGHLHRPIQLPHAQGEVVINGGFVGLDSYGLNEMFTPSDPFQKLFFMHRQYGKTATYDVSLKFAEASEQPPYQIPTGFPLTSL